MYKFRFYVALWAAKSVRRLLKLFGRNSTYLAGKIALKICPDFLNHIGKPARIIAVTGTNGKTTVCNIVIDVLERCGYNVLSNRLGSNIAAGLATSLAFGSFILGRTRFDLAVFEVDERSSIKIYKYIKPEYLLVTNLFRDSITRNAHAEFIADIISGSIPLPSKLILNGNDLISSRIALQNSRVYFGLDNLDGLMSPFTNLVCDIQICPVCHAQLVYDYRVYHHIGKAHCDNCGFQSPKCDYLAVQIDPETMRMTVSDKDGDHLLHLLNSSVFNIYNTIAALSLLREFGLTYEQIDSGLKDVAIIESRFSEETVGDIKIITQLAKELNPIACSRAFDYISSQPGKKELILDIYNMADVKKGSENIAWLYDCDFEYLNNENIINIVITGPKAKDYYFRLLLAGVPQEKLKNVQEEAEVLTHLELHANTSVYIVHGLDEVEVALDLKRKLKQRILEREPLADVLERSANTSEG